MTISYQRAFSRVMLRHSNSQTAVLIIRQRTTIIVGFGGGVKQVHISQAPGCHEGI